MSIIPIAQLPFSMFSRYYILNCFRLYPIKHVYIKATDNIGSTPWIMLEAPATTFKQVAASSIGVKNYDWSNIDSYTIDIEKELDRSGVNYNKDTSSLIITIGIKYHKVDKKI